MKRQRCHKCGKRYRKDDLQWGILHEHGPGWGRNSTPIMDKPRRWCQKCISNTRIDDAIDMFKNGYLAFHETQPPA